MLMNGRCEVRLGKRLKTETSVASRSVYNLFGRTKHKRFYATMSLEQGHINKRVFLVIYE